MDLRKEVKDILNRTPFISFNGLRYLLPDVVESQLKSLFDELSSPKTSSTPKTVAEIKNTQKIEESQPPSIPTAGVGAQAEGVMNTKPTAKSVKQTVFDYLDQNNNLSVDELETVFPDLKSATLQKHYQQWMKGKETNVEPKTVLKPKSITQQVYSYLEQHPEAKNVELQKQFPSVNINTVNVAAYQWRKKHRIDKPKKDNTPTETKPSAPKVSVRKTVTQTAQQAHWNDTIAALKSTITAQEQLIEQLTATIEDLSQEPFGSQLPEEMTSMSLSDVKKIAAVYLKSIKEIPAKLLKKNTR
jgi:uncharacterized coiled-coil protein SlyX